MKPLKLVVLLLTIFLLSTAFTALFYSLYYVVDVQEKPMKLIIADFIGIDASSVNLSFGAAPPGGSANRPFVVVNIYGEPVRVKIRLSGELAPMVDLSKNDFVLQRGKNETVTATASVPQNAMNGTYFGRVRVVFTKNW